VSPGQRYPDRSLRRTPNCRWDSPYRRSGLVVPWVDRQHIEVAIQLMNGRGRVTARPSVSPGFRSQALRPGVAAVKVVADSKPSTRTIEQTTSATPRPFWRTGRRCDEAPAPISRMSSHPAKLQEGTRLRDLAGFGEARDWGLQLAADFAEFKAGRLGWRTSIRAAAIGPPGSARRFRRRPRRRVRGSTSAVGPTPIGKPLRAPAI